MRKYLLAAGIAAATLIPTFALAQQTCEQQRSTRVVGTVAGAGLGALLGSAVAGHGDRTTGAVIGGVGGAFVGNRIAKPNADCAHAYGFYDTQGMWHANVVERSNATGYFDRQGQWVDGAPNGYYSEGRWISANTEPSASGYYDNRGRWVPASASGYYDERGEWVAGAASGYYDARGNWVTGPATGRYDVNGRWISGEASGRRDANGVWIADAQPGYYDSNRRWRAGSAVGYYDTRGQWIATAGERQGTNANYEGPRSRDGAHRSLIARADGLQQRIVRGMNDGGLNRREANLALRSLNSLRQEEASLRHYRGRLGQRDEERMQAKLDDLSDSIRWARQGPARQY